MPPREHARCIVRPVVTVALAILLVFAGMPTHAQTCVANVQPRTPTANFVISGNGTVTDRTTGLIWDQCVWGNSGSACAQGAAATMTWQSALGLAATANGAVYKGYSDWRLPNVKELLSIVDTCRASPSINGQSFPNTISNFFWSGSPDASSSDFAWIVAFTVGYSNIRFRNDVNYVRLVRIGR